MTETLRVTAREDADHSVVTAHGRVFYDTVTALAEVLEPMLAEDRPYIVLDLSGVDICDSSGLKLIVASHRAAAERGGWLRLAGLQPMVRRVIDVTNLSRTLSIHDTVEDAATGV